MVLRRGFAINKGEKALVVEDVITTGGSTKEVIEVIKGFGGVTAENAGDYLDKIIQVDTSSTRGWKIDQVSSRLKGEPGTKVTITIFRAKTKDPAERLKDYTITRAEIPVYSVKDGKLLEGNIGYVRITQFNEPTADEFEKAVIAVGGKVAAREFTNDKATDFAAILTKIKSKKADVVFYGGMDAQGGPMAKQMKSLGLKAHFLTGDGGCTPEFIKLAGAASEGQYCSLPGVPLDQMPGGKAFGDAFTAKYGQIQLYAPYVYDAVMVMVDAMKRAKSTDPKVYTPELIKTNFKGVTTNIAFEPNGELKNPAITLNVYKDGKKMALN